MSDIIQIRRDTTANWASADPTLAQGEIGYDLTLNKWKVGDASTPWSGLSFVNVVGATGLQGSTGVQGIQGTTGLIGATGLQGAQGVTGIQGETGIQGLQGITGFQGMTGLQGVTGIGSTGLQGQTGIFVPAQYNAGSIGATGAFGINWSNGQKQNVVIDSGSTGCQLYFTNGVTGSNSTLEIQYNVNAGLQGITGAKWPGGTPPTLTGQTGVSDVLGFYYNGTNYLGMSGLNFK